MKKSLFTFLIMAMIVSVSFGTCFADGDDLQSYAEEQARIAEMNKPVVLDKEYPQWGFRAHSWISGTGSQTIAHTQVIDMTTGKVLNTLDKKCNYQDPVYDFYGD